MAVEFANESDDGVSVSAVVPVYNEERTVAKVLETLLVSPLINEVVCINDGSTDGSLRELKKFGSRIQLVNFEENQGKGKAVAEGIRKARGEYLLFCDSDLGNFTIEHVAQMLNPVLNKETRVVFAVPTQDKTGRYDRHEVFLAGERVYPRADLLPHLSRLCRSKGAGASEIVLNTLYTRKEIRIVSLIGLIKPPKESKWSSAMATKQYLFSVIGVLQEIGRIEIHSLSDLKQLESLVQADTFEKLASRIKGIKNKKLRDIVQKYYSRLSFEGVTEMVKDLKTRVRRVL